jgi:CelD/BcsL family acetyltransferase involved in cellulose biosynthesis
MTTDQIVSDALQSSRIVAQRGTSSARERFEITALDPTCDPYWDKLAASHPDFTIFHSSAWMRVLSKTYRHKPLVLCWSYKGEPAVALAILEVASPLTGRRGVSLPFTDFCEPLFFSDCDPSIIFQDVRTFAERRSWKHFEIRGRLTSKFPRRSSFTFHGHSLDLGSRAETLFDNFAAPVRRAIRKAERSGLTVSLSTSEGAMQAFYRLHERTRRRHGLPPQPFSFFRNIHREIIQPGQGLILLAQHRSKCVAAAVFFYTEKNAVFKFGAYDERYQDLRPNNLVMWNGIRHFAGNGIEKLHLGRTLLHDEGLRRFKLAWGAVEKPINYFRFDLSSNNWATKTDHALGIHNALFRRLPLTVNRVIGTMLYPHLD